MSANSSNPNPIDRPIANAKEGRHLDPFLAVLEFHERFGVVVGGRPEIPDEAVVALREKLIEEELGELKAALAEGDLVETADALADLLYVVYGTAVSFGIDIRPIFDEVHRSNMTKVGGTRRADGKVLKPSTWEAPEIRRILTELGAKLESKGE